jgi:hypothetical protein
MLEEQELPTLKAAILASTDPEIMALAAARDDTMLTIRLNSKATPTVKAWINEQPVSDSDDAANYTAFDGLTPGKRDSWALFLAFPRDFGRSKVRQWVTDVWGAATAASISEDILKAATRNATFFELMFGSTSATTGTVTAVKLNKIGPVDMMDVAKALNLP